MTPRAQAAVMYDTIPMPDSPRPVEVHLFAAARAAASGMSMVAVPSGSLADVLAAAVREAPGLAAVLPRCSILVEGLAGRDEHETVPPGARVDVLPPFAGG
jgi:molybdopterin synthase sulfur carrier subunit